MQQWEHFTATPSTTNLTALLRRQYLDWVLLEEVVDALFAHSEGDALVVFQIGDDSAPAIPRGGKLHRFTERGSTLCCQVALGSMRHIPPVEPGEHHVILCQL